MTLFIFFYVTLQNNDLIKFYIDLVDYINNHPKDFYNNISLMKTRLKSDISDFQTINQLFSNETEDNKFTDVPQKVFDELLNIYPQTERVIKNCKYSNGKLIAELINKTASYITVEPDYYTASQLVLAISQMGYIIGGLLIKDESFSQIDSNFYIVFLSKIEKLECYYTKFNMAFRNKIIKTNDNIIEMNVEEAKYYPKKQQYFVELAIRVGESFFAETQLITT